MTEVKVPLCRPVPQLLAFGVNVLCLAFKVLISELTAQPIDAVPDAHPEVHAALCC